MAAPEIPKKYKAVIYDKPGTLSTKVVELDTPEPGPGEVLINLSHSGVCHSDFGIMMNSWSQLPFPTSEGQVGGHEGVGTIVKMGPAICLGSGELRYPCAGGGLGHIAVQLGSRGMGYRVIGVDADAKEELVLSSGAEHFVPLSAGKAIPDKVKELTGGLGAHAVVVLTAANGAYAQAVDMLRFGGTLVAVGIPEGQPVAIAGAMPQTLVAKALKIVGVAVGDRREAIETMDFARRGIVKSHHRVEKMDALTAVFEEMEGGKLQGRVVLDLS
ncbi:alcohol dehydrogenase [Neofusicoccum parvum]|nr:alcohol dehydrogenase [Neofusicoccum parvum]